MGFSRYFISSPFPWLFFCALFLGAAASRATQFRLFRARASSDPERARSWKWIIFSLLFSLALITFLAALFVPGPEAIRDTRLLYFFPVCFVFFFLAFRFKKSVGIVFFLLLLIILAVLVVFLQALTAFTGETEIARVRVIDLEEPGRMTLEIIPNTMDPVMVEMEGTYFAPVVRVVIFDDYYVFLGARTWYHFDGVSSFAMEKKDGKSVFRQQDTDYYFEDRNGGNSLGLTDFVWSFYERYETGIPGVRSVQVEMDLKKARPLYTYSIRIQNDGGVQIIPLD